MESCIGLIKCV